MTRHQKLKLSKKDQALLHAFTIGVVSPERCQSILATLIVYLNRVGKISLDAGLLQRLILDWNERIGKE